MTTYDLAVFSQSSLTPTPLRAGQSFYDNRGGQAVTGVLKLSQRWLLEFLTERGSTPFAPTTGTQFVTEVRQGLIPDESAARLAFASAAADAAAAVRVQERETDPADERLDSVTLDDVMVRFGVVTLTVTITSLAGESRTVVQPLAQVG